MKTKNDTINDKAMGLLFLERTAASAESLASRLDPNGDRKYEGNEVLRALDQVTTACVRVLYQAKAGVRLEGAHLLEEEWRPKKKERR